MLGGLEAMGALGALGAVELPGSLGALASLGLKGMAIPGKIEQVQGEIEDKGLLHV